MATLPAGVPSSPRSQKGVVSFYLFGPPGAGAAIAPVSLPLTPEEIDITLPSRQQVTQTLTGAYQDHLGAGVATLRLRGHTGWRGNQLYQDGRAAMDALLGMFAEYDRRVAGNVPSTVFFHCLLDVPSGWQAFRVSKNNINVQRSRQSPLLFRYEIDLTILQDLNAANAFVDPSPNFVISLADPIPLPLSFGTFAADPSTVDPDTGVTAAVTGNVCNTVGYTGQGTTTLASSGTTLSQLAIQVYSAQFPDTNTCSLLWVLIAYANQNFFPPGRATADSVVPLGLMGTGPDHEDLVRLCIPSYDPAQVDLNYLIRNIYPPSPATASPSGTSSTPKTLPAEPPIPPNFAGPPQGPVKPVMPTPGQDPNRWLNPYGSPQTDATYGG